VPHGSLRVGRVEVVALCDGVVLASEPAADSFPGGQNQVWAETRDAHPDVFEGDRWRLHVHCYLLRSEGSTVLVDTGVGPEAAPAFGWSRSRGRLPEELAGAGTDPADVDRVLITHVHDDHLGWIVAEGTADPLFPSATYLIHRADLDALRASPNEEDRAILAATIDPLARAGVLRATENDTAITGELTAVHAPGHTPGHQMVLIDSEGERAIVSGDLVNHPAQLLQPGLNGTSDFEPALAAATRADWLERIGREGRLAIPAHFPEPFGRFEPEDDGRHRWRPLAVEPGRPVVG